MDIHKCEKMKEEQYLKYYTIIKDEDINYWILMSLSTLNRTNTRITYCPFCGEELKIDK